MQQAVATLDEIKSIDDVVRLILQVEGSEINQVFMGVIEATDSPFVRTLEPFRRAVRHHINYICKTNFQIDALGCFGLQGTTPRSFDRINRPADQFPIRPSSDRAQSRRWLAHRPT